MKNIVSQNQLLNPKLESVIYELSSLANVLNLESQEKVLRATRAMPEGEQFDASAFQSHLRMEVARQYETFGVPKASMFICPRVDVRDMSNLSNLFPGSLSISSIEGRRADIFVSRIPRIFQLFQQLYDQNAEFELVLIIGDTDFVPGIGYQWEAIEFALKNGSRMGEFDEDMFAKRVKSYRQYLVNLFRANSTQNDNTLFEVLDQNAPRTGPRAIRFLSSYELFNTGNALVSGDDEFNQQAIDEEAILKLSHYRQSVKKYDTAFFSTITPEEVRKVTESKFQSYRDQGLYVSRNHGSILLSDELPPVLKAEMYRNQLLILWPWIRKEDPERNPEVDSEKTFKIKLVEPVIES